MTKLDIGLALATGIAAGVMVYASCAHAQQHMALGVGVSNCSLLNNGRITEDMMNHWVGGYITAVNTLASGLSHRDTNITSGADINIVQGYIKSYCWKNPQASIDFAVSEVVGTYWSNYNGESTPPVKYR